MRKLTGRQFAFLSLVLLLGACASTTEAKTSTAEPTRKTPCPNVSAPTQGRVDACEAKGGTLQGVETDGCVRGYDCVVP